MAAWVPRQGAGKKTTDRQTGPGAMGLQSEFDLNARSEKLRASAYELNETVSACTPWINQLHRSIRASDCLHSVPVRAHGPRRPRKPKADPTASILTAVPIFCLHKTRAHRGARRIEETASAHLYEESDPGPLLPVECQVDEGRNAYQVKAGGRDVTARYSDRLDGLVDGAGPDGMNLDTLLTPDDSCDGAGHRDRLGGGSNFEHLTGRPTLTRHS